MADDITVRTEWEESAEQGELFKALSAAQGEMDNAAKSRDNPFFKSKYADLAALKDVSQEAMTKYALAITSQLFTRGGEAGVRMKLGHASGQWMACICTTAPKDRGPQAMGSCWSYLRRYAKAALLDIATEDDDGEKAEGRSLAKPNGAAVEAAKGYDGPQAVIARLLMAIDAAASRGPEALEAFINDPETAAKCKPLSEADKARLRAAFEAAKTAGRKQ